MGLFKKNYDINSLDYYLLKSEDFGYYYKSADSIDLEYYKKLFGNEKALGYSLLEIAKRGPDDNFYFGVARVTKQEAPLYEEIKEKGDVAEKGDTKAVAAIIKLSEEGKSIEYNGDAVMEICGYPDNYDDPALDDILYDAFMEGVDNL